MDRLSAGVLAAESACRHTEKLPRGGNELEALRGQIAEHSMTEGDAVGYAPPLISVISVPS